MRVILLHKSTVLLACHHILKSGDFNKSEISDSYSGECDDNSLLSSDAMYYCEQYIDVSENHPP
jgi:hypothetical protein